MQHTKQHHRKVLLSSFHNLGFLPGSQVSAALFSIINTTIKTWFSGFHPQFEHFEPTCKAQHSKKARLNAFHWDGLHIQDEMSHQSISKTVSQSISNCIILGMDLLLRRWKFLFELLYFLGWSFIVSCRVFFPRGCFQQSGLFSLFLFLGCLGLRSCKD